MSNIINVSFPRSEELLYSRIISTQPRRVGLAIHVRTLLQRGLDATCHAPKPGKARKGTK